MSPPAHLEQAASSAAERYDRVAYPGRPYRYTHPDRLATLATLFGMTPAPVDRCRVLELGCGEGANLIPMAFALPQSRFLGIDIAPRSIAKGRAAVTAMGLANITLLCDDLCRLGADAGEFDYIIAHGLFAWVEREVQQAILRLTRRCLAQHGVAYISYNTYPGGYLRRLAREMMLFHSRSIAHPAQQVAAAGALLQAAEQSLEAGHPYGAFLTAELERLQERGGEYLFHDELSPVYEPLYFHEFAEQADAHGLQYLGEAEMSDMQRPPLPPAAAEILDRVSDELIHKEQYLDFFRCRSFRRTLLCRAEVRLNRAAEPHRVLPFLVSSSLRPSSTALDILSASAEDFSSPQGSLTTRHPATKAALCELAELWPVAVPVPELVRRVRRRLGPSHAERFTVEQDQQCICEVVLRGLGADLLELHVWQPAMCARPGERPVASQLARWQLSVHEDVVTTLRHTVAPMEGPIERHLLPLLDGTRDRAALLSEMRALHCSSNASLAEADALAARLELTLAEFARVGLLVA